MTTVPTCIALQEKIYAVASAGYKVCFFVAMELRAPPDGML